MITCKNCGHIFAGNYCNNCGQSSKTKRIDVKFIWTDIEHGLLHVNKTLFHSLKNLFLDPGRTIKEFLEGKRIHHIMPISLCIILATIYAVLYHILKINLSTSHERNVEEATEYFFSHYYWFVVATIPIYAFTTKLFFRFKQYNYWEYLVVAAYKLSQRLFVHILSIPIFYMLTTDAAIKNFLLVLSCIDVGLIIWTNLQFFNQLSRFKIILYSILSTLLFTLIILILITLILIMVS